MKNRDSLESASASFGKKAKQLRHAKKLDHILLGGVRTVRQFLNNGGRRMECKRTVRVGYEGSQPERWKV